MTDKEKIRLYQQNYRSVNAKKIAIKKKEYIDRVKYEGIQAYGAKCVCCGEDEYKFLTIEHINGRDKNVKRFTGKKEWARLKSLGWPTEDITILCFNCNCAKGAHGMCPHREEKYRD